MHLATIDDDEVFDDIFGGLVQANAEGIIVSAHDRRRTVRGIPFTEERVEQLLGNEPMAPAAAARLALAWQHVSTVLRD
jgi:hypothetical protein